MYEVPASKRSIKQNLFEFKIAGKEFSVPKFEYLSVGVLEDIEAAPADAIGPFLDVFGAKGSPVRDAIRTLNKDELKGLIEAWRTDSDVTLGESSAS